MPFLPPNQQHQSTEGKQYGYCKLLKMKKKHACSDANKTGYQYNFYLSETPDYILS